LLRQPTLQPLLLLNLFAALHAHVVALIAMALSMIGTFPTTMVNGSLGFLLPLAFRMLLLGHSLLLVLQMLVFEMAQFTVSFVFYVLLWMNSTSFRKIGPPLEVVWILVLLVASLLISPPMLLPLSALASSVTSNRTSSKPKPPNTTLTTLPFLKQ
jgi:hypothetical protein